MATTLAKLGATVVISSRKADVISATAADIASSTGSKVLAFPADVRDAEQVAHAIDQTVASVGLPDIVINNAAGAYA